MEKAKQKVMLVTHCCPYPLLSGGALAQYYFIDGLKDNVDFIYCTPIRSDKEYLNFTILHQQQPLLKMYCFDERKPISPKRTIKTILKKVLSKRKNNYSNAVDLPNDDYTDVYFQNIDHNFSQQYISFLNNIIVKESISIVQCDFYETIDLSYSFPETVKVIFVCHELRFKRLELSYSYSKCPDTYKQFILCKNRDYELNCLKHMDQVIVFNEDDAGRISKYCKTVTVSPYAIPDELIYPREVSQHYQHIIFIGGEGHTPNKMGLTWFLDEIVVPNMDCLKYDVKIIGRWSESFQGKYKCYPNIIFTGFVDSIRPLLDNAIMVNPILSGAGIRTKILEALANKVPVLSTLFGAEGCFDSEKNSHIAFFDSAKEFLDILNRAEDNSFLRELAYAGYEYYNNKFNKRFLLELRKSVYDNMN